MMGSDVVVFPWPDIDCQLRLFDAVEPFGTEYFSAQRAVEPFVLAILPGATWVDFDRSHTNLSKPFLEVFSNEIPTIFRTDKFKFSVFQKQTMHDLQNIVSTLFVFHLNTKRLAGIFIQDGQHLIAASVTHFVVYKVDSPNMIGMRRS